MSNKSVASKWGRDKSKVSDGIWVNCDDHEGEDTFQLKVRYLKIASNPDYAKCVTKLTKPYRRQSGDLSYEVQTRIAMKAFCRVILVDWKNAYNDEGELIPFNEENAFGLMESFPDLYEFISTEASDPNNFDMPSEKDEEDAAKNSATSSSTSWSSEAQTPPPSSDN